MKKIIIALVAGLLVASDTRAAQIFSFDQIELWAGDGAAATNRAALLIQWNDGNTPTAIVWGFGWNSGTKTGMDMLTAVAGLTTFSGYAPGTEPSDIHGMDSRLTVQLGYSSFGDYVNSVTYIDGITRSQTGFSSSYWAYYCMGGVFDAPPLGASNTFLGSSSYPGSNGTPNWSYSWTGAWSREIDDGSWDAWSYGADDGSFVHQAPPSLTAYAAVPEPSPLALWLLAFGVLYVRKRLHSY